VVYGSRLPHTNKVVTREKKVYVNEQVCIGCRTCIIVCSFSRNVLLWEEFDEDLLRKELEEPGFKGRIDRINNSWYSRKKNSKTWILIGESQDRQRYFPVRWDTSGLENGQYEIMGLMRVFVEDDGSGGGKAIARENIVEVTVQN
jgi:ferredoxin